MKGVLTETAAEFTAGNHLPGDKDRTYTSVAGIKIVLINNEPHFPVEELGVMMKQTIKEILPPLMSKIQEADDARRTIMTLTEGIGALIKQFKTDSDAWVGDIRNSRFTIVSETAAVTKSLAEVRKFFLGSEHREEMSRITEFVDLCERLQKLKASGFLDAVADTLIKLA